MDRLIKKAAYRLGERLIDFAVCLIDMSSYLMEYGLVDGDPYGLDRNGHFDPPSPSGPLGPSQEREQRNWGVN